MVPKSPSAKRTKDDHLLASRLHRISKSMPESGCCPFLRLDDSIHNGHPSAFAVPSLSIIEIEA